MLATSWNLGIAKLQFKVWRRIQPNEQHSRRMNDTLTNAWKRFHDRGLRATNGETCSIKTSCKKAGLLKLDFIVRVKKSRIGTSYSLWSNVDPNSSVWKLASWDDDSLFVLIFWSAISVETSLFTSVATEASTARRIVVTWVKPKNMLWSSLDRVSYSPPASS